MKQLERLTALLWLLAALWLVLRSRYLPMNDAPSHIATGVIFGKLLAGKLLAGKLLAADPFFAAHYQLDPVLVPYWATALWLIGMTNVFSPLFAFQLLILLYVVLLPLSCRFLLRAFVSQPASSQPALLDHPLAPLCVLAVFHWGYWMGESNYLIGQPVALFALGALWRAERLRSGWTVLCAVLAALSYLCHIYALTLLLIAATAWALVALLAHRLPALSPHKLRPSHVVLLGWIYVLFGIAAYFVLFQHGSDANRGTLGFDLSLRRLAHMLIDPFDAPQPAPRYTLLLMYLGLLSAFVWAHHRTLARWLARPLKRSVRLLSLCRPALLVPGLTLLAAAYLGPVSILAPDGSQKEGEIAIRFVLGGFLLLILSLRWPSQARFTRFKGPRGLLWITLSLFALVQLQFASWTHARVAGIMSVLNNQLFPHMPPHQRVLPLLNLRDGQWSDYLVHRAVNYVVLHDSYSPHVFAVKGQHALRHIPWGDQREVRNFHISPQEWSFYDYVLYQGDTPELPPSLVPHLTYVAASPPFVLYRIRKPATTPPPTEALPPAPTP